MKARNSSSEIDFLRIFCNFQAFKRNSLDYWKVQKCGKEKLKWSMHAFYSPLSLLSNKSGGGGLVAYVEAGKVGVPASLTAFVREEEMERCPIFRWFLWHTLSHTHSLSLSPTHTHTRTHTNTDDTTHSAFDIRIFTFLNIFSSKRFFQFSL